jgi:serine/threonine-protein kinase
LLDSQTEVGNWIVGYPIGKGDSGTIYRVHHRSLGTLAALKALSPALTAGPDFAFHVRREGAILAGLQHPHIARLLDLVECQGVFYVVSEYLEGGTLLDRMRRADGLLALRDSLEIARHALAGLDYAHQQTVIHRNLSTAAIMLDHRGAAKVTDFAIAFPRGASPYRSPEQTHDPETIDTRSDIYSIGVVLYEMLTGRLPFDASGEFEARRAHSIPPELEAVVLRAIREDPEQRYQRCSEFSLALANVEEQIAPGAVSRAGRESSAATRTEWWIAAAMVALGLGGLALLFDSSRERTAPLTRPALERADSRTAPPPAHIPPGPR